MTGPGETRLRRALKDVARMGDDWGDPTDERDLPVEDGFDEREARLGWFFEEDEAA